MRDKTVPIEPPMMMNWLLRKPNVIEESRGVEYILELQYRWDYMELNRPNVGLGYIYSKKQIRKESKILVDAYYRRIKEQRMEKDFLEQFNEREKPVNASTPKTRK